MNKTLLFGLFCWLWIGCEHPQERQQEEILEDVHSAVARQNKVYVQEIPEKIIFPSIDSLPIHANLYHIDSALPIIVLCHQAGYNKVEYTEIAKVLNDMGFNCLAIDQRSGGNLVEWFNETKLEAIERGLPTEYLDAQQDIIAAVEFAAAKYKKEVLLVGSSYSATLVLNVAIENKNVNAVIAFSPGDYFPDKINISKRLTDFKKPMFVTSSKEEAGELTKLISTVDLSEEQLQYVPESEGVHGAKALWKTYENNEEYWIASSSFREKVQ
jgi:pimeloyl-ACP methyl ester carboxylesterase